MTTTYDMNDTATLAHDPYVSEYGDGYGTAYGTGYDTDHGAACVTGGAYDDGRAVGGTYGGGYGVAGGYGSTVGMDNTTNREPGRTVTGGTDSNAGGGANHGGDAGKPSIGDRVDTALDGMRSTFDKVVGTTKEKLADGGWDRAERNAAADGGDAGDDGITYNQIHDATPDPAAALTDSYGGSTPAGSMAGTGVMGGDKQTGGVGGGMGGASVTNANSSYANTTGSVSEDCGAVSGRACGTRQADSGDSADNVNRVRHDIRTATDGEDEI